MAKVYGDRWEIISSLRSGGQADTFVVKDLHSPEGAEFVLKRVRNPERYGRFRIEVEALKSLNHPNVVKLVEYDLAGEKPYLVMEYCIGGSLDRSPDRWAGDPAATLDFFAAICDGVKAAHDVRVTHRDIKPANILLRSGDGPPVVADFGIAFAADGERQTLTEEAVGARKFTAPELADGRADLVTARSDVYSLGKLLYWMLAGGQVFDREKHRDERYDLARGTQGRPLLEHVNRMLDNMLTVDPQRRYEDAGDVARAARQAADLLRRHARVLSEDLPQQCAFCQVGTYRPVNMEHPTHVGNFGLRPVGRAQWRALICDRCGNVQLFRPDRTENGRWWGPAGGMTA